MKLSIVPSDGFVYVDGVAHTVDMSDMPNYINTIQWYGSYGEIEFAPDSNGRKLPNVRFSDIAPYAFMTERWEKRKSEVAEKIKYDKEAELSKQFEEEEKRQEKLL